MQEAYDKHPNKKEMLTIQNKRAGATALHLASNNGHAEIVKFLVDKIVNDLPNEKEQWINKKNKFGFTPLMSVCFRGYLTKGSASHAEENRLAIVKCLIENGANPNYQTVDTLMTATHWAAYNKDHGVVKVLLEAGSDHFAFSHMGRLPIDVAGSSRAYAVLDTCLETYFEKVAPSEAKLLKDERLAAEKYHTTDFASHSVA